MLNSIVGVLWASLEPKKKKCQETPGLIRASFRMHKTSQSFFNFTPPCVKAPTTQLSHARCFPTIQMCFVFVFQTFCLKTPRQTACGGLTSDWVKKKQWINGITIPFIPTLPYQPHYSHQISMMEEFQTHFWQVHVNTDFFLKNKQIFLRRLADFVLCVCVSMSKTELFVSKRALLSQSFRKNDKQQNKNSIDSSRVHTCSFLTSIFLTHIKTTADDPHCTPHK